MQKRFIRLNTATITFWVSYSVLLLAITLTPVYGADELLHFEPENTPANNRIEAQSPQANDELLSFSNSPAPTIAQTRRLQTPSKGETVKRATPPAAAPNTSTIIPERKPYSVSAVAFAGASSRANLRTTNIGGTPGPSESELRHLFSNAVEAAMGRSPKIFRARAEEQAADADVDEAKGQRWPQVDVGTQTKPLQLGKGSENETASGGVNLSVTTTLYDWGRTDNSIESRKHLSSAASESLEAEKENIGFEVVNTLIELGKQRLIVELSQQLADRMEDLVKMLAGIVAVDKGRASELTQAKARLLQALALRDAANAQAQDAEITLTKLVGERPVQIPHTKEWNIAMADLDQLLGDVKEHPTIRQASAEAESAELQAKAVRASGLPKLNWVVSKNTGQDSLGREQPWQTNLSMTWAAFRGGSTRAAERAALSRADGSRQQTAQQLQDLEFRIRTADHDARTQLERAELYRALTLESGRIREDFFLQWHHLGKRTLLDVLTAENEHYSNQVSEITNRFNCYQAISREYAAAGVLERWLSNGR